MEYSHTVGFQFVHPYQNLPILLRTCIHKFPVTKLISTPTITSGSHDPGCCITALVQSPAIDVVGIGFTSGEISVYDIRADERLMRMYMEGGGIRALGFRTGQFTFVIKLIGQRITVTSRWTSNSCLSLFGRPYSFMGS